MPVFMNNVQFEAFLEFNLIVEVLQFRNMQVAYSSHYCLSRVTEYSQ